MVKVNSILNERLKKNEASAKMTTLAKDSAAGRLTSFAGVFAVSDLNKWEKEALKELLLKYKEEDQELNADLEALIAVTCEVKAINHQAIILHGERIKRAQNILKPYRDGAFTSWLVATYGNRQTPYNFLQYYEFLMVMPKPLHEKIESMPRQVVYVLASREGTDKDKAAIVSQYTGEPKQEVLNLIRKTFPLAERDKRQQDPYQTTVNFLSRLSLTLDQKHLAMTTRQKSRVTELLDEIHTLVNNCTTLDR